MYTSPQPSPGRTFPPGRVYPIVDSLAPPENETESTGAVRLRYPFKAPPSRYLKHIRQHRSADSYTDNNEIFDLFFYLPVTVLSSPGAVCRDVVIMFQGTNETRPWHTRLYDRLGESLAQRNVAAILLPTPFHLNRSAQRRQVGQLPSTSWADLTADLETPTKVADFARPYANFHQTFLEVDRLVELIRGKRPAEDPWHLYKNLFGESTRISLLGFSMGGLRALAKCLKDNGFHKCILLSSGGPLDALQPPDVELPDWRDYVHGVMNVTPEELVACLGRNVAFAVYKDLTPIFFSPDNLTQWQLRLEELANQNRILVILGTRDPMRAKAITRMQLAELHTIAGMRHRLGVDIPFELRYWDILRMITRFVEPMPVPPAVQPWPRSEVRDRLRDSLSQIPVDVEQLAAADLPILIWTLPDGALRTELMDLYILSKARFESDGDLLDSLRRSALRRSAPQTPPSNIP